MPYKLLLADDSVTIQRVIELTFADEDVNVTAVSDGQQAIDHIVSDRPDIVLADVGMPKHDGYEVAAFIKADPALKHIPVLLLTGAFEPVDEDRARAVCCDGVLAKPFEPQLLIGRVKDLLKGVAPSAPAGPEAQADDGGAAAQAFSGRRLDGVQDAIGIDVDDDATVRLIRPPILPPDGDAGLEVESLGLRADPAPAGDTSTLDDYFDRLDAAFAHLTGGQPGRDGGAPRPGADPWSGAVRTTPVWPPAAAQSDASAVDELDPDRRTPVVFGPGPDVGASSSPADDLEALASRGAARPSAAGPAIAAVPVADAFAALLDAEREHGVDAAHPGAPDAAAMVLLPGTRVTSAFVDDVARRVIERLGEPAFREVIRDVVPSVAERLIREEIERIKSSV
jgi:CheY-like chemotaxis protein